MKSGSTGIMREQTSRPTPADQRRAGYMQDYMQEANRRASILQPHSTWFLVMAGAASPTSSPLVLLECLVAGTTHRDGLRAYEPRLQPGQALQLQREADSAYDDWAVRVLTAEAEPFWLGYLPEGRNETVARLLDAGYPLSGRLTHKAWEDEWLHLEIEVLLERR